MTYLKYVHLTQISNKLNLKQDSRKNSFTPAWLCQYSSFPLTSLLYKLQNMTVIHHKEPLFRIESNPKATNSCYTSTD